jgi:hypothetical protein
MESMTSAQQQLLADLNCRLEKFLEAMKQPSPLSASDDLLELLKAVVEAGEWVKESAASLPDPVDSTLKTYRRLLERLRGVLPVLQVRLRMERAQLKAESSQLAGAAQWTSTTKATLSSR